MFEDRSAEDVVEDGERAPLGVVIATVAGTLALGSMLGIVSIGTMNGMRSNAIENVRAQVMAGQVSQVDVTSDDGADGGDGSAQVGYLDDDGKGAADVQENPVDSGGKSDGGKDVVSGVDKANSKTTDKTIDKDSGKGSGKDADKESSKNTASGVDDTGKDDDKDSGKDVVSDVDDVIDSSVRVDGNGSSVNAASFDTVYDVEWGDTLSDISRRFGVSVDEIATANGIWDSNLIYADSSLKIPRAARGFK